MTETTNPTPDQPAGATPPLDGPTPASSDAQELTDAGALEGGGDQWGPTRPPKTDAADDSAGGSAAPDPLTEPGRSALGGGPGGGTGGRGDAAR